MWVRLVFGVVFPRSFVAGRKKKKRKKNAHTSCTNRCANSEGMTQRQKQTRRDRIMAPLRSSSFTSSHFVHHASPRVVISFVPCSQKWIQWMNCPQISFFCQEHINKMKDCGLEPVVYIYLWSRSFQER